jgi:uncharacterized protein
MLRRLVAVFALFAALAVSPAFAEEMKIVRNVTVSGQGEVRVVPDTATITIGVASTAASAREALDANTKAMNGLMDVLQKAGIDARDIATSNFSVGPRYDYNNQTQPPKVLGYDVNNSVTVVVRKLDDLGGLLDVAVSNGSNQINGVSFSVSKPEAALDEARKLAVVDARRKAEIYAAAGNFKLGDVLSVSEGVNAPPPVLYQTRAGRAQDSDVPIAQGEQALAVNVTVQYEIR